MSFGSSSCRLLLLAGVAGLVVLPAFAGDDGSSETVRVAKVVIRQSGDATNAGSGQSVMIKTRKVDGAGEKTEISVPRDGASPEVFQVDDLAVGDSQTFQTANGRSIDVKRTEKGLSLSIDGKTIELPGEIEDLAPDAAGGPHDVRVVKVIGGDGDGDGDVVVKTLDGDVLSALPEHMMQLDKLESLKGLDPACRDKVMAALHEILSQHQVMTVQVDRETKSSKSEKRHIQ